MVSEGERLPIWRSRADANASVTTHGETEGADLVPGHPHARVCVACRLLLGPAMAHVVDPLTGVLLGTALGDALGVVPDSVARSVFDLLAVMGSEDAVRSQIGRASCRER